MIISYLTSNIDSIVAGLISGLLLVPLLKAPKYVLDVYKLRNKINSYVGDYYIYSYSSSGLGYVVENEFEIKARFGKLVCYEDNDPFKFKGYLDVYEANLFFLLKGVHHQEHLEYVFHNPFHNNANKIKLLWGLGVGSSVTKDPYAFKLLMSNKQIPLEDVKDLFMQKSKGIKCDKNALLIPMTKDIFLDNA